MPQVARLQQHPGVRVLVIKYILRKYKIKTIGITLKKSKTARTVFLLIIVNCTLKNVLD
jgi:hypothetical protein